MPLSDKERKALTCDPSDYAYQYTISSTKTSWLMVHRFEAINLNVEVCVYTVDKERVSKIFAYTSGLLDLRSEYILSPEKVFNWCGELWMIFPHHVGWPLGEVLKRHYVTGLPSEPMTARILLDVVTAMEILHKANLGHRALNPSTLFLEKDTGITKLKDLLSAKFFGDDDKAKSSKWVTYTHLKPPELIGLTDTENHGEFDERKADIFLFAITAMTLAYGYPPPSPYARNAIVKPADWIMPNEKTYHHQSNESSLEFREMIRRCLAKSPQARPTAEELKKDKFFSHVANRNEVRQTICSLLKFLEPPRAQDQPPSQMNSAKKTLGYRDLVRLDRQVETKSSEMDNQDHNLLIHTAALMGDSHVSLHSIESKDTESIRTNTRFEVQNLATEKYSAFKDSSKGDEHSPHDSEATRITRYHVKESVDGTSSEPAPLHHPIKVNSTLVSPAMKRTTSRFKVERVEDVSGVPGVPVQSPHKSIGLPPRVQVTNVPIIQSAHPLPNVPGFEQKEPLDWNKKDVCDWLHSLGGDFTVYTDNFRKAGIDGDMLQNMTADELQELEVNKKIHRRRILTSIKKLRLDTCK